MLIEAEIPSQKFFFYCPTAQMAEFMFPNMAYRATVYRTGLMTRSQYPEKRRYHPDLEFDFNHSFTYIFQGCGVT